MRLTFLSVLSIFAGALAVLANTLPAKTGAPSSEAGRLMQQIKINSEQIRTSAHEIERLAKTPDAKWPDYDVQWNKIKPAQEAIDRATWHLERMQSSLSAAEQKSFTQMKRDAAEVTGATHDLWLKLGRQNVDLKTPALNADARGLDKAARELMKETAPAS